MSSSESAPSLSPPVPDTGGPRNSSDAQRAFERRFGAHLNWVYANRSEGTDMLNTLQASHTTDVSTFCEALAQRQMPIRSNTGLRVRDLCRTLQWANQEPGGDDSLGRHFPHRPYFYGPMSSRIRRHPTGASDALTPFEEETTLNIYELRNLHPDVLGTSPFYTCICFQPHFNNHEQVVDVSEYSNATRVLFLSCKIQDGHITWPGPGSADYPRLQPGIRGTATKRTGKHRFTVVGSERGVDGNIMYRVHYQSLRSNELVNEKDIVEVDQSSVKGLVLPKELARLTIYAMASEGSHGMGAFVGDLLDRGRRHLTTQVSQLGQSVIKGAASAIGMDTGKVTRALGTTTDPGKVSPNNSLHAVGVSPLLKTIQSDRYAQLRELNLSYCRMNDNGHTLLCATMEECGKRANTHPFELILYRVDMYTTTEDSGKKRGEVYARFYKGTATRTNPRSLVILDNYSSMLHRLARIGTVAEVEQWLWNNSKDFCRVFQTGMNDFRERKHCLYIPDSAVDEHDLKLTPYGLATTAPQRGERLKRALTVAGTVAAGLSTGAVLYRVAGNYFLGSSAHAVFALLNSVTSLDLNVFNLKLPGVVDLLTSPDGFSFMSSWLTDLFKSAVDIPVSFLVGDGFGSFRSLLSYLKFVLRLLTSAYGPSISFVFIMLMYLTGSFDFVYKTPKPKKRTRVPQSHHGESSETGDDAGGFWVLLQGIRAKCQEKGENVMREFEQVVDTAKAIARNLMFFVLQLPAALQGAFGVLKLTSYILYTIVFRLLLGGAGWLRLSALLWVVPLLTGMGIPTLIGLRAGVRTNKWLSKTRSTEVAERLEPTGVLVDLVGQTIRWVPSACYAVGTGTTYPSISVVKVDARLEQPLNEQQDVDRSWWMLAECKQRQAEHETIRTQTFRKPMAKEMGRFLCEDSEEEAMSHTPRSDTTFCLTTEQRSCIRTEGGLHTLSMAEGVVVGVCQTIDPNSLLSKIHKLLTTDINWFIDKIKKVVIVGPLQKIIRVVEFVRSHPKLGGSRVIESDQFGYSQAHHGLQELRETSISSVGDWIGEIKEYIDGTLPSWLPVRYIWRFVLFKVALNLFVFIAATSAVAVVASYVPRMENIMKTLKSCVFDVLKAIIDPKLVNSPTSVYVVPTKSPPQSRGPSVHSQGERAEVHLPTTPFMIVPGDGGNDGETVLDKRETSQLTFVYVKEQLERRSLVRREFENTYSREEDFFTVLYPGLYYVDTSTPDAMVMHLVPCETGASPSTTESTTEPATGTIPSNAYWWRRKRSDPFATAEESDVEFSNLIRRKHHQLVPFRALSMFQVPGQTSERRAPQFVRPRPAKNDESNSALNALAMCLFRFDEHVVCMQHRYENASDVHDNLQVLNVLLNDNRVLRTGTFRLHALHDNTLNISQKEDQDSLLLVVVKYKVDRVVQEGAEHDAEHDAKEDVVCSVPWTVVKSSDEKHIDCSLTLVLPQGIDQRSVRLELRLTGGGLGYIEEVEQNAECSLVSLLVPDKANCEDTYNTLFLRDRTIELFRQLSSNCFKHMADKEGNRVKISSGLGLYYDAITSERTVRSDNSDESITHVIVDRWCPENAESRFIEPTDNTNNNSHHAKRLLNVETSVECGYHLLCLRQITEQYPNVKYLEIRRDFPKESFVTTLRDVLKGVKAFRLEQLTELVLGQDDSVKTHISRALGDKVSGTSSVSAVHDHLDNLKCEESIALLTAEHATFLSKPTKGCERFVEAVFDKTDEPTNSLFPNLKKLVVYAGTDRDLVNARNVRCPDSLSTIDLHHLHHFEILDVLYSTAHDNTARKPTVNVHRLFADVDHVQTTLMVDLACKYKHDRSTYSQQAGGGRMRRHGGAGSASEESENTFHEASPFSREREQVEHEVERRAARISLTHARCYSEEDVFRFSYGMLHHVNGWTGTGLKIVEHALALPFRTALTAGGNTEEILGMLTRAMFPNANSRTQTMPLAPDIPYKPVYGQTVYHHYLVAHKCADAGADFGGDVMKKVQDANRHSIDSSITTLFTKVGCFDESKRPPDPNGYVARDNMLYKFNSYTHASCAVSYINNDELEGNFKMTHVEDTGVTQMHVEPPKPALVKSVEATDEVLETTIVGETFDELIIEIEPCVRSTNEVDFYALESESGTLCKLTQKTGTTNAWHIIFKWDCLSVEKRVMFKVIGTRMRAWFAGGKYSFALLKIEGTSITSNNISYVDIDHWSCHVKKTKLSIKPTFIEKLIPKSKGGSRTTQKRLRQRPHANRPKSLKRRPTRTTSKRTLCRRARDPVRHSRKRRPGATSTAGFV